MHTQVHAAATGNLETEVIFEDENGEMSDGPKQTWVYVHF
jgi:hypothetical protein